MGVNNIVKTDGSVDYDYLGQMDDLGTQHTEQIADKADQTNLDSANEQLSDIAINVKNFGAKGDGVTDDTSSIQAALDYADSLTNSMKLVYLSGVHSINANLTMHSNVILCGDGANSELQFESPSYHLNVSGCSNVILRDFKCTKFAYGCIQLQNNSQNITIKNLQFASTYQDFMFGVCIMLYTCSDIMIDNCTFIKTGYQILQQAGYVSNNVIVQNCKAYQCYSDFVELNCENSALSRNWIIRNNRVYNSGMYQKTSETYTFGYAVYHWTPNPITTPNTEGRFVGITWCDNVLIEGNIVEGVGGDSAIHIEEPMNVVIKDNTIKNAHSLSSRFVFCLTNGTALTDNALQGYGVPKGEQKLTIKDNTFILDDGVVLSGDAPAYLLISGKANTITTAFTDFGVNNHYVIESNKFLSFDPIPTIPPYVSGYPRVPTSGQKGYGIELLNCYANVYIEKNLFQGLLNGIQNFVAVINEFRFGAYVNKNKFNNCSTAILNQGIIWALKENSFSNCVAGLSYSYGKNCFIQSVELNHFVNTPVSGLNVLQICQRTNKYIDSSNDDYTDPKIFTAATTSVQVAKLPKALEQTVRGLLIISAKSNTTNFDGYFNVVYNIEYFYLSSGSGYFIGSLSLINSNNGSTKVSALTASLDTTNGLLNVSITSSEDYQLSCSVIGY